MMSINTNKCMNNLLKILKDFFGPLAKELLSWDHDFHTVKSGTLKMVMQLGFGW